MANREVAVSMRDITKEFGTVIANNKVNLDIYRGEILSLLGENGSGKTTLMNMLSGIYYPDGGEVYINGEPAAIHSPKEAFGYGIGMIHQHFKLVSNYTIAENIIMGTEPMKRFVGLFPCIDMRSANAEVARLSSEYGLEVNPTKRICDVPVSVQQRVEILKMLYREADILIFDEPTNHLDMESITALNDGMTKYKGIMMFTSHDHQLTQTVANKIVDITDNKVVVRECTYDEYLEEQSEK